MIQFEKTATEGKFNWKSKGEATSLVSTYAVPRAFCLAVVSLFEVHNYTSGGGATSPSSHLAPSTSGLRPHDVTFETVAKALTNGRIALCSIGSSIVVEISI